MATTKRDVTPLLDIQSAEFARQYQLGAYWARYGDEQGHGPQADTYLISNINRLLEKGHCNEFQSDWFPHLGFYLGMVHGGVVSPQTSELWLHVTTLVTLSDPCFLHGYRAGRVWFFYEADADERRLSDTHVMQRLHELARERHAYKDEEGTINFALGCIVGELSGQLFPLTLEEQERIQEEDRRFLAEDEARRAGKDRERDTEPLPITVLQEV